MGELPRRKHVVDASKAIHAEPGELEHHTQKVRVEKPAEYEDAADKIARLRSEQYALTAVVISKVFEDFDQIKQQYPPYGLIGYGKFAVEDIANKDIADAARTTMQFYIDQRMAELEKTKYLPVLKRLGDVLEEIVASPDSIYNERPLVRSKNRIVQGSNTFLAVGMSSLKLIAYRMRSTNPDVTVEEIAKVARNSSDFLAETAKINIQEVGELDSGLQTEVASLSSGSEPNTNNTHLVTGEGGLELRFKRPVSQTFPTKKAEGMINQELKTLNCPAGFTFEDEDSAIKKLWLWLIELAELKSFDF